MIRTKDELLQQFDFNAILNSLNTNRQPFFEKFWEFLNSINTEKECQKVLKFITGSIKIPTRRLITVKLYLI